MISAACCGELNVLALLIRLVTGIPFHTCGVGALPPVPCRSMTIVAKPSGEN